MATPSRVARGRASRKAPATAGRRSFPGFIEPQLAELADAPPQGSKWVHEIKFDGYRAQIHVQGGGVTVYTRRGENWTRKFPHIAKAASELPDCIIDGEAVVLTKDGHTDFDALQSALGAKAGRKIQFYAFDLLFVEGDDLRKKPLADRKVRLREILEDAGEPVSTSILYSEHFTEPGQQMREAACAMGLEGIVSKRIDATYRSTRNDSWIKSKCGLRETFVVGGWRQTAGGMQSIALGVFRNKGFEYVGKARTGFQDQQRGLLPRFKAVEASRIPFTKGRPEGKEGQHWCRPELQAEVSFTAYSGKDQHIRHAKFLGLREDIPLEIPKASAGAKHAKAHKNAQRLLKDAPYPEEDEIKAYWRAVGKQALKYLAKRPLTLVRHDRGQVFFHTGPVPATGKHVKRLTIEKRGGGEGTRLWIDSVLALVELADIGVVEVHPWNATVDDLEHPDQFILDLDPGDGVPWQFVQDSALALRDFLAEEGLNSWPKATGGKGLHVMVPLDRKRDHDQARAYSLDLARKFAARDLNRYTTAAGTTNRVGKIFIDYLRNGRGQTGVGAYSPRARPNFPIALPMTWKQVERASGPSHKNIKDFW